MQCVNIEFVFNRNTFTFTFSAATGTTASAAALAAATTVPSDSDAGAGAGGAGGAGGATTTTPAPATTPVLPATTTTVSTCDSGWTSHGQSCYKFVTTTVNTIQINLYWSMFLSIYFRKPGTMPALIARAPTKLGWWTSRPKLKMTSSRSWPTECQVREGVNGNATKW